MEFNPKVSIVIPVYNGSNYMREAIDSALAQTYQNIEIIVVNDGSNDDGKTEEIAKSYGDKIRYFYKENGGVASALNLGIREMSGEYFSWLSHDDIYYPNKIEKQIEYLLNEVDKNIITFCDFDIIDENSTLLECQIIDPKYLPNQSLTILSTSIHGCSLLIPKACFDSVGGFNEKLKTVQDIEMWFRFCLADKKFVYIPEVMVKSRRHAKQGSVTMKDKHQNEREELFSWAITCLGKDVNLIDRELENILLGKRCFKAHRLLMKAADEKKFLERCFSVIKLISVKYPLIGIGLAPGWHLIKKMGHD